MLRNYFKTAWRNIVRNKTTTIINLFGLSVALVAFIFIALWVQNELSFDNYHTHAKDIYLVQMKFKSSEEPSSLTSLPVADVLKKNHDVEYVARMGWWAGTLNVNGNLSELKKGAAVDSDWFNIFHYDIISGDINSFSRNPFSIIFTQSKAEQLFGNKNPVGEIVKLDTTLYQVRAVIKDNPNNSSLQFDMLVPMAARLASRGGDYNNWGNMSYRTFVKIHPNTDITFFTENISALSRKTALRTDLSLALQSLQALHFDTKSNDPIFRHNSRTTVFIFTVLGLVLLITASINYINLTIARANTRTKEISIRKIIGDSRMQLFFRFLCESFLLCVSALFISIAIIQLILPVFNNITESKFQVSFSSPLLWSILLGTLLFTTLLNGIFPALTMAFFRPLDFLHGYTILRFRNVLLRKGLVVFQFTTGVVFIIGTIIIFKQMRLAQASAAQYNRTQVVSFSLPFKILEKMDYDNQRINSFGQSLKNELLKNSNIQGVTISSSSIDESPNSNGVKNWYWKGMDTSSNALIYYISADASAKDIFNLDIKEGRWFGNEISDKKNYVLNETAVKELGIHLPVIGQLFARKGEDTGQIIGVIKDFSFNSVHEKTGSLIIRNDDGFKTVFFVKLAPGNIPKAMNAINGTWKKYIPDAPLDYQFTSETFDNLYKDDLKISKLALWFSCISIIISSLGLLGLATFIAEQRTKEIGIRKVMGASVAQITTMLSKDFIKLVALAVIIASPVAWWLMNKWLQNFAYQVNIGWEVFVSAGCLAVIIALITISFQTIKAATANPVKSLRTE
ncbi:MAG TPA: ABC transporter permease [Puia sp.]|nr:ABC transporter permease [Puia sp.]